MKIEVRSLLKSSNFIVLYKPLIKKIGLEETAVLQYLVDWQEYVETNEGGEEWFYCTEKQMEEDLGLSAYQQRRVYERLIELGVLEKKLAGMPAKNYFKLNFEVIYGLIYSDTDKFDNKMLRNLTTRCEETSQQDVKKLHNKMLRNLTTINNNNKTNNKTNNETNNIYIISAESSQEDKLPEIQPQKNDISEKDKELNSIVRSLLKYFGDWFFEINNTTYNCSFQYEFELVRRWVKFFAKKRFDGDIKKAELLMLDLIDIYYNECLEAIKKNIYPNISIGRFHKQINRLLVMHNDKNYTFLKLEKFKQLKNKEVINK